MSLGSELRACRKSKGYTQRDVATAAGISMPYLCHIERDQRMPAMRVLRAICEVLDVDPDVMMAFAGRLDSDVQAYLQQQPAAGALLRKIAAAGLIEAELHDLIEHVEELRS